MFKFSAQKWTSVIPWRTAFSFGGAVDDENKISLVVEEPTSEGRTIVVPDASGRLVVGLGRNRVQPIRRTAFNSTDEGWQTTQTCLKDILSNFCQALTDGVC